MILLQKYTCKCIQGSCAEKIKCLFGKEFLKLSKEKLKTEKNILLHVMTADP